MSEGSGGSNPRGEPLADQVSGLQQRVQRLEQALRLYGIAVDTDAPGLRTSAPVIRQPPLAPPVMAGFPAQIAAPRAPAPPTFTGGLGAAGAPTRSLESQIGSHWFNRIGVVAVLIAAAWFLKLAIDNRWIGPLGRVLIGLLAGAGAIAWSDRFRRKQFPAFSYSLNAVGTGILYLSLWVAFQLYHLMPAGVAFGAMVVITAFNGYMAWRHDAELLALYSIVGGFSTPALLSTGGNHEVFLMSYLVLLDAAVLLLLLFKPWSRLLFGAFAATVVFFLGWAVPFYTAAQFGRTTAFLLTLFLIFAFAPRLMQPVGSERAGWDALAFLMMPVANAGLTFLALYVMLEGAHHSAAEPWVAVAFAAFYLLLLRLPGRGRLRAEGAPQAAIHLTCAVVLLALAIPLQTHGRWLTIGWLIEGAALLWASHRVRLPLLRVLALLCLLLGLLALLVNDPAASLTPLLNQRFATYCVAIAVFAGIAWGSNRLRQADEDFQATSWSGIAAMSVLVMNALILLAVSREIHSYWWYVRWHGNGRLMADFRMYAQFTYSAYFMLFGSVLLLLGFLRESAFTRWQALVLLAATIGKVFLVDVSQLSEGFRILSFLGLGVLLLAVSFVYQRDWLHLRPADSRAGDPHPDEVAAP